MLSIRARNTALALARKRRTPYPASSNAALDGGLKEEPVNPVVWAPRRWKVCLSHATGHAYARTTGLGSKYSCSNRSNPFGHSRSDRSTGDKTWVPPDCDQDSSLLKFVNIGCPGKKR